MRIYGDVYSGNCYKILLACRHLQLDFEWQHVDILKGETRNADFLSINPNGKIPLLALDDGRHLAESNAILNYLADGSALLPSDRWERAQVLQWQFYEQYSHEPYVAVARYIQRYLGLPEARRAEYETVHSKGYKALQVMESHLAQQPYFAAGRFSIADISLYAYTHVAEEGGISLADFPAIRDWIDRIAAMPAHISMDAAAAQFGKA